MEGNMPIVKIQHTTEAPADQVWRVLLDCEVFPSYMEEVLEVTILRQGSDNRLSRWLVLLKGSELNWEELEHINHTTRRIEFDQTEGDLAYFTGFWQVAETSRGTNLELHVEFDIGIPLMADLLNPVATRALEDNSRAILHQIGQRASTTSMRRSS